MKRLAELVRGIPCEVHGKTDLEVKGIAYHSARVEPGFLFVAIDGFRTSGARFIDDAINRGATAVATTDLRNVSKNWVSTVVTAAPRRFLAQASSRFYDFPARKLSLVGVTGTNGKTTTAYLLRSMARAQGIQPGFLGTVEYWDGAELVRAPQTTPESLDFVRLLDRLVANSVPVCIAEVSSHALELDRVSDLDFQVAVFTNLTQDHLDFHRDLRSYEGAKMKLFTGLTPNSTAVVNLDDRVGLRIVEETRGKVLSYGIGGLPGNTPDVTGEAASVTADGLEARLRDGDTELTVRLRLTGRHNLYNLLAAYSAGKALGWPAEAMVRGAEGLLNVPGRLERVPNDRGLPVFVDYAHTPDALRRVLETVREFTAGRVICVFGCGGDRDRDKRPKMGAAVADRADLAFVTSDNPRTEPPDSIIEQILSGMGDKPRRTEPDRRRAIELALAEAKSGDTIVIAGKGHEEYQIVGTEKLPFDDRAVARALLAGR